MYIFKGKVYNYANSSDVSKNRRRILFNIFACKFCVTLDVTIAKMFLTWGNDAITFHWREKCENFPKKLHLHKRTIREIREEKASIYNVIAVWNCVELLSTYFTRTWTFFSFYLTKIYRSSSDIVNFNYNPNMDGLRPSLYVITICKSPFNAKLMHNAHVFGAVV